MTTLDAPGGAVAGGPARLLRQALVAAAALAIVALAGLLVSLALGPAPAPPPRNPFGLGIREGGGAAGGIAGWILAVQADFHRRLTGLVRAFASEGASAWPLVTAGFLYGVFHAAGPGHGKAVISAWIVANESAFRRGVVLAFASALLQAVVAVTIVATLAIGLGATARTMTGVTGMVETASFAAVAALGAWLLWRKAGDLARRLWPGGAIRHAHEPGEACGPGCGHLIVPPLFAGRDAGWRGAAGVVLAAGLRPCTGAIIVLVFALAQGVFGIGIAAVLAMAAGTALVTGTLAALSVYAKSGALKLASAGGPRLALTGAALETLAAAIVLSLGATLLAGIVRGGGL